MAERRRRRIEPISIGIAVGVLLVAVVVAGAFAGGLLTIDGLTPAQRESRLVEAGVSIMPDEADADIAFRTDDCEAINLDPDCAAGRFRVTPASSARGLIVDAATGRGWALLNELSSPQFAPLVLEFEKDDFRATVVLEGTQNGQRCDVNDNSATCMVTVSVQRDGFRLR